MTYTIHFFENVLLRLLDQLFEEVVLEELTVREKNKLDSYVWFIYNLYGRKEYLNHSLGEYTSLHSCILVHYLGAGTYKIIIHDLEKQGVIKQNNKYSSGNFPKSYAFMDHDIFLSGNSIKYQFTKSSLINKLLKRKSAEEQDPFLDTVYKHVSKYNVSYAAIDWLDQNRDDFSLRKQVSIANQIETIQRGDISVSIDKYGRLYNDFVHLPKEFRSMIVHRQTGSSMNFVDVDIAACLPFIFGALVLEQYPYDRSCQKFMELVISDDFYTEIFDFMQYELESLYENFGAFKRDYFKKEFLTMLNNKPVLNKDKELYRYLEAVFPKHARYLDFINGDFNNRFHKKAMKIETKIMVQSVFKDLINEGTESILIHDGVLVKEDEVIKVISMIKAGFSSRFDIEPRVRMKVV